MIFVKPAKGLRVRHPDNPKTLIAEHGAWLKETTQLTRLINDGDLVVDEGKQQPVESKKGAHKQKATGVNDGHTK